jgi:hypothetical protein
MIFSAKTVYRGILSENVNGFLLSALSSHDRLPAKITSHYFPKLSRTIYRFARLKENYAASRIKSNYKKNPQARCGTTAFAFLIKKALSKNRRRFFVLRFGDFYDNL